MFNRFDWCLTIFTNSCTIYCVSPDSCKCPYILSFCIYARQVSSL